MNFTMINFAAALSPFLLAGTLWGIWKEARRRSVMLRMMPPERRPVYGQARGPSRRGQGHAQPLWTLRDCRMELLTEGVMMAFDASIKAYVPDLAHRGAARAGRRVAAREDTEQETARGALPLARSRGAAILSAFRPGGPRVTQGPVRMISYFASDFASDDGAEPEGAR